MSLNSSSDAPFSIVSRNNLNTPSSAHNNNNAANSNSSRKRASFNFSNPDVSDIDRWSYMASKSSDNEVDVVKEQMHEVAMEELKDLVKEIAKDRWMFQY